MLVGCVAIATYLAIKQYASGLLQMDALWEFLTFALRPYGKKIRGCLACYDIEKAKRVAGYVLLTMGKWLHAIL